MVVAIGVEEQHTHAKIRLAGELAQVVALAQDEVVLADGPAVERHVEAPFAHRGVGSRGTERGAAARRQKKPRRSIRVNIMRAPAVGVRQCARVAMIDRIPIAAPRAPR